MDDMISYKYYFPINNIDTVCKLYAQTQRNRQKHIYNKNEEKKIAKYTFYNNVIRTIIRLKHYLLAQEKG